jgi:hypothetical protein
MVTGLSNFEIDRLLTVFGRQPLSKLSLLEIPDLDMSLLERIVATFPRVEELALFTSSS